jgi:hypothetical protein
MDDEMWKAARELIGRIHAEMIARCTCNTKSPELQYHDLGCTFRVLGDAAAFIEQAGWKARASRPLTDEMVERACAVYGTAIAPCQIRRILTAALSRIRTGSATHEG